MAEPNESNEQDDDIPEADAGYTLSPRDPELVDPATDTEPKIDLKEDDPWAEEEQPFQFSMAEMFGLMAGAALLLGLMQAFSPGVGALIIGVITLIALVTWPQNRRPQPIVILAWWVMLGIYLLSCVMAIIANWNR